jgi:ADP-ribosylation factor-like protein 1
MGSFFSSLFSSLWTKEPVRILILGLDGAGKTTILYRLALGDVVSTVPTVGFNVETCEYKNVSLAVWDLGGQTAIRPFWRCYTEGAQGVIFVVDSADTDRLKTAREALTGILAEEELSDAALLVFANKQDLPGAQDESQVAEALGLDLMRQRPWSIHACSATKGERGEGLEPGMDWLVQNLNKQHGGAAEES